MESKVAACAVGGVEGFREIEGESDAMPDASAFILFLDPIRSYWLSSSRTPPLDLGAYLLGRRMIRDTKLRSRLGPSAPRVSLERDPNCGISIRALRLLRILTDLTNYGSTSDTYGRWNTAS